jgi:hypothetical protein
MFSEQEASAILRRAAQLQEVAAASEGQISTGVSYGVLQRIASEAGIEKSFLAKAFQSASLRTRSGPLNIVEESERILEGEVAVKNFAAVAQMLSYAHGYIYPSTRSKPGLRGFTRMTHRQSGPFGYIGRRFSSYVELNSDGGVTRIRVRSSLAASYLFGLMTLLTGPLFIILGPILFFTLAGVAVRQSRALADSLAEDLAPVLRAQTASVEPAAPS